ncbi:VOC family protein [Roseivirga misakiensis]|uniref:Glyoxalase n=1 Tax=Roseivirga misakiensis TaxID=1563681 RepID=A0A1E5T0Y4_9BACT|nr:VOC family protein [Roseivirga misakiensis]OEK04967.1 glyoxalase [Roseivirga misakiensis]
MRYAHTNIVSKNWETLVDFYIKTFECTLVPPTRNQSGKWLEKGTGVKNAELKGAHLRLPGHGPNGPTLEIYQYSKILDHGPIAPNYKGFSHIAFEVDNVSAVLAAVQANGGLAHGEITERVVPEVGKITFVYAKDPEGNLIELQSWD